MRVQRLVNNAELNEQLEAAGVAPNDPTNSHQAVAKLKSIGFETRYQGRTA
jgi:hypothetical protein